MASLSTTSLSSFPDLRKEGIQILEVLSSSKWDDFNTHDPGITMLEVLCVALTELGLKANADVPDLINQTGSPITAFLPSVQAILTNNAVTNSDFQKIIADTPGVHCGWYIHNPLPPLIFFFNPDKKLSFINNSGEVVRLKGLFDIYFQPQRPELVGNILRATHMLDSRLYFVEIAYPYWDDFPAKWHTPTTIDPAGITVTDTSPISTDELLFIASFKVSYSSGTTHSFPGIIRLTPLQQTSTPTNRAAIWNDLSLWLSDPAAEGNLLVALVNSVAEIAKVHTSLSERLEHTRNLCTDILSIAPIRIQEVSITTELEISGVANLEEMIAQLYLQVDELISPRVLFQPYASIDSSLVEPSGFYEGPLLTGGMLDETQLSGKTVNTLYTSDLTNVLLKKSGSQNNIIAITDLYLTNYLNNHIINPAVRNCLRLPNPEIYRVKFSAVKSNIQVFKEGNEIPYDKNKMLQYFFQLQRDQYYSVNNTLDTFTPALAGKPRIDEYTSIQHDFPEVYGIDEGEIPTTAPVLRIAEARQLKGYLLFFEQVMANATAQIANAASLFDINPGLAATKFTLPLYNVPGIEFLLKDFSDYGSWSDFVSDQKNGYRSGIREIAEDKHSFLQRRAAFLDHLLARFGEDVHEYCNLTLSYFLGREKDIDKLLVLREQVEERLIQDRIRLLKDLPELSASRSRGMHFQPIVEIFEALPGSWNWVIKSKQQTTLLLGKAALPSKLGAFDDLVSNFQFILNPGFTQVTASPANQITVLNNQVSSPATVVAESPTFITPELARDALKHLYEQVSLIWNSDNISGLEKRVKRLLGFPIIQRRDLVAVDILSYSIIKTTGILFGFSITLPGTDTTLHSDYVFADQLTATNALKSIVVAGIDRSNYSASTTSTLLTITLTDPATSAIAKASIIPDQNTVTEEQIKNFMQFFIDAFGPQEGFYIIEHILLRPKVNGTTQTHDFIQLPDAPPQLVNDPYSYQVTVVLPDGKPDGIFAGSTSVPSRLLDPAFRTLVEKTIRQECPAHIIPRFLTLDLAAMTAFQKTYMKWIMLGMTSAEADEDFATIQNDLLIALTT
jgi:hypothetical protein